MNDPVVTGATEQLTIASEASDFNTSKGLCVSQYNHKGMGGHHISGARIATLIDNRNVFFKAVSQIYTKLMRWPRFCPFLKCSPGGIIKQSHDLHPLLLIFYKLLYRHQNQGPLLLDTLLLTLISYVYGRGSKGVDSSMNKSSSWLNMTAFIF